MYGFQQVGEDHQRRFWQSTQHPAGIYSEGVWKEKINYLHVNPYCKGLVLRPEDWRFSFALFWLAGEASGVQLADAGWECEIVRPIGQHLGGVGRPAPSEIGPELQAGDKYMIRLFTMVVDQNAVLVIQVLKQGFIPLIKKFALNLLAVQDDLK